MVSIKSLTLLALSITAATATPQYQHARFHRSLDTAVGEPIQEGRLEGHPHRHRHADTKAVKLQERADENGTGTGGVGEPVKEGRLEGKPHRKPRTKTSTTAKVTTTVTTTGATTTKAAPSTTLATSVGVGPRWERTRTWTWGPPAASPTPAATGTDTSASAAPSADSSYSSNGTSSAASGTKKGLSYNANALLNQFSSAGASWAYNWAAGAGGNVPAGVEFVPMLWGRDGIGAWSAAVEKAISGGSKHVLSFNEPDFPEQANIDAASAAKLHIANVAPYSGRVKVGSPAITNSNIGGQGLDWMKSFLAACGGASNNCKIDFLAFHWYNNPGTMDNFKSHVSTVINLAKANGIPKVWLTEFAVNGGTDDQAAFVKQAIPYLESQPEVERYAYFMVGNGQMLTNGALNAAGKAYAG